MGQNKNFGFCENARCDTVIFTIDEDDIEDTSCPACGRFGRMKDKTD